MSEIFLQGLFCENCRVTHKIVGHVPLESRAYQRKAEEQGRSSTRVLLCTLDGWEYSEIPANQERERVDVLLEMGFLGSSPMRPGMREAIGFLAGAGYQ